MLQLLLPAAAPLIFLTMLINFNLYDISFQNDDLFYVKLTSEYDWSIVLLILIMLKLFYWNSES
jgi:hypothetical protein